MVKSFTIFPKIPYSWFKFCVEKLKFLKLLSCLIIVYYQQMYFFSTCTLYIPYFFVMYIAVDYLRKHFDLNQNKSGNLHQVWIDTVKYITTQNFKST